MTVYRDNLRLQRAILAHEARRRSMLNVILLAGLCWAIALGLVL